MGSLFVALLLAPSASADTIQVDSPDDGVAQPGCSLREAIDSFEGMGGLDNCNRLAAPGTNTVTFAPGMSGSTIPLDGNQLDISATMSIVGPGADDLVVDANDLSRALLVTGAIDVDISGLTLRDGVAPTAGDLAQGGCVFNQDATLTLEDVRVTDCETEVAGIVDQQAQGGGVYSDGPLTLDGATLDDNSAIANNLAGDGTGAYARGGGLYAQGGEAEISNSTISGNTATAIDGASGESQAAGGILAASAIDMTGSTVSGNTATATQAGTGQAYSAGGLHVLDTGTIDRSTIAGNASNLTGSAATFPSGILVQNGSDTLTLTSSTIASNGPTILTALDGANLFVVGGTATLTNNILADPSGHGTNCIGLGTINTGGYNIDNSPAGPSCFTPPGATDTALDPLLATAGLADNGGPTETIALQPASPAIDAGSNVGSLSQDQRGLLRPVDFSAIPSAAGGNGTDIGAFEVQLACAGQATPATTCPSGGGGGTTTPTTPTTTGKRAAALKKCKKIKDKKKRNKCKKKAQKQPV